MAEMNNTKGYPLVVFEERPPAIKAMRIGKVRSIKTISFEKRFYAVFVGREEEEVDITDCCDIYPEDGDYLVDEKGTFEFKLITKQNFEKKYKV